jgi:hypothetical protein
MSGEVFLGALGVLGGSFPIIARSTAKTPKREAANAVDKAPRFWI